MVRFECAICGEAHEGMPSFGWNAPFHYLELDEESRASRASLGSDDCVIDESAFFVRGCLEIPVRDVDEPFTWGVWVSLSEPNFRTWVETFDEPSRSHVDPFFGWLCTHVWVYDSTEFPTTLDLKTSVQLRDDGIRPLVTLEPTRHPLSVEQHGGIALDRVVELHTLVTHPTD